MTISFNKISFTRKSAQLLALAALFFAHASLSHAELYITDDYLKGLDAEVESVEPQYPSGESQKTTAADIKTATQSRFNFESLLRKKHKTSFVLYNKLTTSERVLIYDAFKESKDINKAKQMIINKFESR